MLISIQVHLKSDSFPMCGFVLFFCLGLLVIVPQLAFFGTDTRSAQPSGLSLRSLLKFLAPLSKHLSIILKGQAPDAESRLFTIELFTTFGRAALEKNVAYF